VSGKKGEERAEEGEQYYAMERTYGSVARSFSLPDSVDGEQVTAELNDGVLKVMVPKRPEVQPKQISITKGGGEAKAKA